MVKRLVMYGVILIVFCLSFVFVSAAPQAHATSLAPQGHATSLASQAHAASLVPQTLNGTDPYATGCAGSGASWWVLSSSYIYDRGINIGYVQLWWSQTCQTNWARFVCNNSSWCGGYSGTLYLGTGTSPTCSHQGPSVQSAQLGSKNDVHTYQEYLPTTQAYAKADVIAPPDEIGGCAGQ